MDLRARLTERFAQARVEESFDMAVLHIAPGDWASVAAALRDGFGFDLLADLTAVDWPGESPRFELVAHFYSTRSFARLRLKCRLAESDPTVDSLTALYGSAAFMERETHDMFGIRFAGNADLRPILLYEGFVGHPLRKDYAKDHAQPLVPFRTPAA